MLGHHGARWTGTGADTAVQEGERRSRRAPDDRARAAAFADPTVQKFIGDKPVRKVVFVPGKLVNVVV